MSRIFISHSSLNSAEAMALRGWLQSMGWDDVFLDLDPERGLKAGERWQAALKQAAERCELVIFVVSPEWAASKWCLAEFLLAQNLNKRIFGVIVKPAPFADLPIEMTAEWQLVDLTAGNRDHQLSVSPPPGDKTVAVAFASAGLDRLRIGLMEAGLDPSYFPWPPERDPDRAPYRGLQPLEAADAGIFFGREGYTVLGLEALRSLRDSPPPRLLVMLGASGAGKSSFLRAGLTPRLARDSQHFLPLPVIRPERAVLSGASGLITSLEQTLKQAGLARTRIEIGKAIENGPTSVASLLSELVAKKTSAPAVDGTKATKPPTLVFSIDQAEELFRAEGAVEAGTFLDLLRALASNDTLALIALFTIRSDSYERMQTAASLQGLRAPQFLSLPPMPKGAYADVIKGPAKRLEGTRRALEIEEPLVNALLSDIEEGDAKDALPLLAFTLERLYRMQGGDGNLKLKEYEDLGKIKGSIEAAVEEALKAADADPKIPNDRQARLALLRRGLIPWLAGIDPDTGTPRRAIARQSEIPPESRPLIDLLVDQRLLSTDVEKETGEVTIEPAHEALLRQWGLLNSWLAEDRGLLGIMEGIKRASREWKENGKDPAWLTHMGESLKAAEGLDQRKDLAAKLGQTDRDYLAACRKAEQAAKLRPLKTAGAAVVGMLLIASGAYFAANEVYQQCYQFDPQSGKQSKLLGPRTCQPGELVFLKFLYGSNPPGSSWPNDRPNRVLQARNLTTDQKHVRWFEQDLTGVNNGKDNWGAANHYWVTVVDDTGIGDGMTGYVLRRIDLQAMSIGNGKTQCDSDTKERTVLEIAFPQDTASRISPVARPDVRMRWVLVSCAQEVGADVLTGGDFADAGWPIVQAVADPTFGEWIAERFGHVGASVLSH